MFHCKLNTETARHIHHAATFHEWGFCLQSTHWGEPVMRQGFTLSLPVQYYTCEGALQESPPLISPMRAAAVGLLELMRTGPLISMEWRWGGGASMGLWDMVREVKECRFLLFFFSPARWAPLLWGPEEAPSPESPLESDGLSNSISWRAAELNYGRGREAEGGEKKSKVEITEMLKWSREPSLSKIKLTAVEKKHIFFV